MFKFCIHTNVKQKKNKKTKKIQYVWAFWVLSSSGRPPLPAIFCHRPSVHQLIALQASLSNVAHVTLDHYLSEFASIFARLPHMIIISFINNSEGRACAQIFVLFALGRQSSSLSNVAHITLDRCSSELTSIFALLPHMIIINFINNFEGRVRVEILVLSALDSVSKIKN